MSKPEPNMPTHLRQKRSELMWALSKQGYNGTQIALLFGVGRSTAFEIIKKMPKDWETPWSKKK